MEKKNHNRVFRLKIQLTAAIFALIGVLISGFFIFGPDLVEVAKALNPNDYNKEALGINDLTVQDWDRLDADFVAKSGDTMTGPLTLPGDPTANLQAATRQYVDNNANAIKDYNNLGGLSLRMVCGRTNSIRYNGTPTNWEDWGINNVAVNVNIPAAGFTTVPYYFVSLGGEGFHLETTGGSSVYAPTATSFRSQIHYIGVAVPEATPEIVKTSTWDWHIMWCAVGR